MMGCPNCGADTCHFEIDAKHGAGQVAIAIRDRWGRKRGEVHCENGCDCPDCKAYWKAHTNSLRWPDE